MSQKRNAILAITGMTGVGKDFLVERANRTSGLSAVNLGTLIGQKLNLDRDLMMRTIDPKHMRAVQLATYREIIRKQPLIVTCHTIRPLHGTLTYDLEIERLFNPSCYVFVAAPPEVIAQRVQQRNIGSNRNSEELSVHDIAAQQNLKLQRFKALTDILGCDIQILHNTEDNTMQNVAFLRQQIAILAKGTAGYR